MNVKVKGILVTLLLMGILASIVTMTQATAYGEQETIVQDQGLTQDQEQNRIRTRERICQNMGDCEFSNGTRSDEAYAFAYQQHNRTRAMHQECTGSQAGETVQCQTQHRQNASRHRAP